ncbi:MAG TPA: hypothetical protein VNN22_09720 [Verrucomicrobiae bacterium]|nr:hypothetical protein [Verrucomicrobiae bacterium]
MSKKLNVLFIVIAGILGAASAAQAQIYSTWANYGSFTQGDWTIYNDVWGVKKPNTQQLFVNSINSWYVNTKQNNGGVKSYPNTAVYPNTPLAQMQSATATFNTTSPVGKSGYWWDWTFDCWSANSADEVMILTSYYPSAGGWGTKIATNVTIGGILYKEVWQAAPGWNVVQFIPAQQMTSGTLDILAVWNWAASHGLLVNTDFDTMQFGVEITSTGNTWQTFGLNYSASWSNKSGGGSGI